MQGVIDGHCDGNNMLDMIAESQNGTFPVNIPGMTATIQELCSAAFGHDGDHDE